MTLLRWLTFLVGSLTVTLTVLFFWIFFSDTSTCPTLGNSDLAVVSVFIRFLINSKQHAPFHRIFMTILMQFHGRDVPWRISLNSVLLLLLVNFVNGFRLELMYVSLVISIRSNPTHLQGFQ